jgi:pyruvate,water dikinase
LAQLAQRLDGVADAIKRDVDTAQSVLKESAQGREFLNALEKHLSTFGHQLASFDLRLPTLADDPRPVLTEIQAFVNGKQSPVARQQNMERERQESIEIAFRRLSARDQEKFRNLLDVAQNAARTRENALFDVGLAWTLMHRCAVELGERFVRANVINKANDIFWLRWEELQMLIADNNQSSMLEPVRERQHFLDIWSKVEPPYILPVGTKPSFWWKYIFPTPELQQHPDAHTLVGLGVSPGKITATARVIRRIEEMDQLNPGEILVAHTTTPAWTPLFAKAAGLVTDLGGPLAHGSIVAREYGIPAVMGTGNATRTIQSGQTITVYGSEGKVRLE